ncbi:MAG TPA: CRTAC1 family protein, partial [Chitinophagaceae bacterium]|nr:CRTAC1 family protein [Chitinophagaceae bacterium]
MIRWVSYFFVIAICVLATSASGQHRFREVSDSAGIHHEFKVFEGMFGGGACVFDFNNDGFEDLYITGGMNNDRLYKNNGNGTFTDVYAGSGLELTKQFVTQGVASADVNRDGFRDLLVTTITRRDVKLEIPRAINLLFLNNGKGGFRDVTTEYGLGDMNSFSTGASFGDINADGWPDIYIGNYFNDYRGTLKVINDATIVASNQTAKDYLLINENGKKYKEASAAYGVDYSGFGFGGVFTDVDNDRDQDIIVNHDFGYKRTPNLLLENKYPDKAFKDIGRSSGMNVRINSMGAAVGDYDNDGDMDYLITNIGFNNLMVNEGNGARFSNQVKKLGLNFFAISWGANFSDFDHDGDLDLFVANGDLNPNCKPMADFYFDNVGGKFNENAAAVGLADYGIGRGSVVFDYDKDGDEDLLVVNQVPELSYPVPSLTHLYKNENVNGNWIKISLKGVQAESNGIGSRIEIEVNGKKMIREIDGGSSSHLSQNSVIAHFGLGDARLINKITVYWTGGNEQVLTNVPVNQYIEIKELPSKKTSKFPWLFLIAGTAVLFGIGLFV